MSIKNLGLAFGLAFMLLACEEPNDLADGLGIQSTANLLYEKIPLNISMTLLDSIATGPVSIQPVSNIIDTDGAIIGTRNGYFSGTGNVLSGRDKDDILGETTAIGFTTVTSGTRPLLPNDSAVVNTLKLKLEISSIKGGNLNTIQHFDIYELSERIDPGKTYFSKESIAYDAANPIGSIDFSPISLDTMKIEIPLDNALAERFIRDAKVNKVLFSTDSSFVNYFNGIAIVPGSSNDQMYDFNLTSANSNFELSYTQRDSIDSGVMDSTFIFTMPFISNADSVIHRFTHIDSDRSGTPLLSMLTEPAQTLEVGDTDFIGSQSLTGILPVINLDNVYDFIEQSGDIKINRAELVLKGASSFAESSPPLLNTFYAKDNLLITSDSLSTRNLSLAQTHISELAGGTTFPYDTDDDDKYQIFTTLLLEVTIDRGTVRPDLILAPTNFYSSFNKFIVQRENVMLHLYYTKIK